MNDELLETLRPTEADLYEVNPASVALLDLMEQATVDAQEYPPYQLPAPQTPPQPSVIVQTRDRLRVALRAFWASLRRFWRGLTTNLTDHIINGLTVAGAVSGLSVFGCLVTAGIDAYHFDWPAAALFGWLAIVAALFSYVTITVSFWMQRHLAAGEMPSLHANDLI